MTAIAAQPDRRAHRLRKGLGGVTALGLLLIGWSCAGHGLAAHTDPPDWLNSVLTVQTPIAMTPAMSVADRLTELRRAKEAAHHQLIDQVLSLRIQNHGTIGALVAERPQLRQQIEAYVSRVAVVEVDQRAESETVRARVEVGSELLDLLHLKTAPEPVDRNTPSTGIVRPL